MRSRRVEVEDAPAVALLLGELGYPTTPERVVGRLARLAPSEHDEAWVALDGTTDDVVALAAAHVFQPYELDRPVAELTALVVTEGRRRSGAGAALVAVAEEWASSHGCVRITVSSALHRDGAHAFYGRLGYEQRAKKLDKTLCPPAG